MLSDNFFTSAKFIGSVMKPETSEPDYPKAVNSCEISFKTVLNTLCKPFPMLWVDFNTPFHSDFLCLIRSRISLRYSLLLTFGWVWLPSWMSSNISVDIRSWSESSPELIFSISCLLIIIDSLSDSSQLSGSLRVSVNMFPFSNCANLITSPVFLSRTSHTGYTLLPDASPSLLNKVVTYMITH